MRTLQKPVLKKFKEIAKKHNIALQEVIDIETYIWRLVKENMTRGDKKDIDSYETIYLRYLGTFFPNKGKFWYINKKK